jgi:hypothetical protein
VPPQKCPSAEMPQCRCVEGLPVLEGCQASDVEMPNCQRVASPVADADAMDFTDEDEGRTMSGVRWV